MKKIVLIVLSLSMLTACSEKSEYEQAVLEDMKQEKDVKDYNLSPETMTRCIVDLTSNNMPGVVVFDPKRRAAYRNYKKMLTLTKVDDPQQVLKELREDFGSPKALADARSNYTESMMNCLTSLIMSTEQDAKEDEGPSE